MAKEGTQKAVSGAIQGVADPGNQRQLVDAIDEQRLAEMINRLSVGIADGVLDTLEDPVRRRRLEAILGKLAGGAGGAAMDAMLAHVLDEKVQVRMGLALRVLTAEFVTTIYDTSRSRIGDSGAVSGALGVLAHDLARQATRGFQEALDDIRREREVSDHEGQGALVVAAGSTTAASSRMWWTVGIGVCILALIVAATLLVHVRKSRLYRTQMAEREEALQFVAEAIKSTATMPGANEFHAALRRAMSDRAAGERLRDMLGEEGRRLLGVDQPPPERPSR